MLEFTPRTPRNNASRGPRPIARALGPPRALRLFVRSLPVKSFSRLAIAVGVVASSLVVTGPLSAQTASVDTYDSVDGYSVTLGDNSSGNIEVTGVLQGASAATTTRYGIRSNINAQACERMIAMTLLRPGRFTFAVEVSSFSKCILTKRP